MASAPQERAGHPEEQQMLFEFMAPTEAGPPTEDALRGALRAAELEQSVHLEYLDDSGFLVAAEARPEGGFVLRARRSFRRAPREVAEAVVRLWLGHPDAAERRALAHQVQSWHEVEAPPPPSPEPHELVRGMVHELPRLLAETHREFLPDEAPELDVTFGPRASRRTLGRHERRTPRGLIVVNPVLDDERIPAWYLRFLLFHESLHELIPPVVVGGRLEVHPAAFRRREALHPDCGRAREFERWVSGPGYEELLRARARRVKQRARARRR